MKSPDFKRAIEIASNATVDETESGLTVLLEKATDASLVTKIADMYNYSPNPTEVASENVLHFVEIASLDDGDIDEDEEESEEDDEDSDEEEDDEVEDNKTNSISNLDDDGRSLTVLNSSEAHRFALKIYQGMLGNENMGGYAAFLQDFDRFLKTHKGKEAISFGGAKKNREEVAAELTTKKQHQANILTDADAALRKLSDAQLNRVMKLKSEWYDDDESKLIGLRKSARQDRINYILKENDGDNDNLIDFLFDARVLKAQEYAAAVSPEEQERVRIAIASMLENVDKTEAPWEDVNSEVASFETVLHYNVEMAKKKKQKNGRAGLLSALMKAISGDIGDKVVAAWDKGDADTVKSLLMQAATSVASKLGKLKTEAASDNLSVAMRPELTTILMKATEGELGEKFFGSFAEDATDKTIALWGEVSDKVVDLLKSEIKGN